MSKQTKSTKDNIYSNSYKHGNLMMISTMIGMCTLLVMMLLSTAFKTVSSIDSAFEYSKIISVFFLLAAIVTGVFAVKKDKALWEYCIYSLVMSIGFLCLCGTPFFLPKNIKWINSIFTTRYAQAGINAFNIIYIIWALIYHTVKSEKKK